MPSGTVQGDPRCGAEGRERTIGGMAPLLYSLQFRGFATSLAPRVLDARATAPTARLLTTVGRGGLAGGFEWEAGEEAVLESRIVVDDGDAFHVSGRIIAGSGNVLRFRTLGTGRLGSSPDPHLRQGAVVCEVLGGEGQFAGASGRIASTLLLSDSGEITETQVGVLFTTNGGADIDACDGESGTDSTQNCETMIGVQ